jgi:arylsulfate sulfotransferase
VIHSRLRLCSFIGMLLLICGGCATSSFTPFETAVTPTANPLVAQYSVRHDRAFSVWVEFGTDTTYGRQTSVVSDSSREPGGSLVNVLVAGMLPQTTYHMRAHVDSPSGTWVDDDHTFTTGPLPGPVTSQPPASRSTLQFPAISVTLPTPGLTPAPGVELLDLTTSADASHAVQAVATDLLGHIIWYCPGYAFPVKPMQNGHFIVVANSSLQEIDLSCRVIREVTVGQVNQSLQSNGYSFIIPPPLGLLGSNQFHHDVLVLPNDHWIALCQIAKTFTDLPGYPGTTNVAGDAIVDVDLNGNVAWAWSSFDHLDVHRYPYFGLPDWTHANALVYTADGNLLVSMRHQAWLLKIEYENGTGHGDILWKLGPTTPSEGAGDFTLLGSDVSQWFYAQHYPSILSTDGFKFTMAIYDNGNFRIGSDGTFCGPPPATAACYSRVAIFDLDEVTHVADLTWQYLPGFYSLWGGNAEVLSNGQDPHVEFASSAPFSSVTGSQIHEVTQTDTPQVVWQMNIDGVNAYRGYRIPSLYPGVVWQK